MERTSNGGHIGSRKKMVIMNETVSSGDTAISLHTFQLPPWGDGLVVVQICIFKGGVQPNSNRKCQDLCKSALGVGANSNPKCQDLSKSAFMGVRGPSQLKPKVPRSVQICIYGGWQGGRGGGIFQKVDYSRIARLYA